MSTGKPRGKNRRLKAGIASAFLGHRHVLAGYLARYLLPDHEIEDLLQEAVALGLEAETKTPIRSPKSYLFMITRNLMSKRLKQDARSLLRELDDAALHSLAAAEPLQDVQVHFRRKLDALQKSIENLPPQCRRVFLMRKVYGYSHKSIASKLSISTSTVERHITTALGRLAVDLRKAGYNANPDTLNPVSLKPDVSESGGGTRAK